MSPIDNEKLAKATFADIEKLKTTFDSPVVPGPVVPSTTVPFPAPRAYHGETCPASLTYTFSRALDMLKLGTRMTRLGWNGKGMFVAIQWPDANSEMSLPYLWMRTADGNRVPWLASQTDLLAGDWFEA